MDGRYRSLDEFKRYEYVRMNVAGDTSDVHSNKLLKLAFGEIRIDKTSIDCSIDLEDVESSQGTIE